jgi:mRNA interferase YafQ
LAKKTKPKAEEPPEPTPPLILETTPQYERDLKRHEKRGKSMEKLHAVIGWLQTHQRLPRSHRDHALQGDWDGYRERHIGGEGDWLMIYVRHAGTLILSRTGKHEEILQADAGLDPYGITRLR